jgi:crotonobetainyl-CoA:carnitine CoA-transferase CaiB-like acyl-CoA transferase
MREHPSEGPVRVMAPPERFSRTSPENSRLAPLLGEHTAEILREVGYDQARIDDLVSRGICNAAR